MADKKSTQNGRNQSQENPKSIRFDLLLSRSESPRVQTILLHQKLKEDIERNPNNRIRYVDSELHYRNIDNRSQQSKRNRASCNIDVATSGSDLADRNNTISNVLNRREETNDTGCDKLQPTRTTDQVQHNNDSTSSSCQVCIIKDMTQDLMNITKMVRERNEQLCKLKSKYLRSYFERLNK